MPTYDYRCPKGHDFEHFFRKMSDATAELACPVCGDAAVRRVSAGAGLVFKGSGFYLTDYGKNAHRGSAPDTAKSDGPGAAKTDAKGDSAKADGGTGSGASSSDSASSSGSSTSDSTGGTSSQTKSKGGDTQ